MSGPRVLERMFLAVAIGMTLALLWVSVLPRGGVPFAYGGLHDMSHFWAYVVLALAWRRGLPRVPAWTVLVAVVAFAFFQEAIEMAGHSHGFELADALIDAGGALVGAAVARAIPGSRAQEEK